MPSPLPILALFENAGEMLLVFLLVLIFFGGEKLPEFARGLGKVIRDFKKAAAGVEEEIKRAMEEPPEKVPPKKEPPKTIAPPVFGTLDQLHTMETAEAPPSIDPEPPSAQPPPDVPPAPGTLDQLPVTTLAEIQPPIKPEPVPDQPRPSSGTPP
jgi:sec-independent protein translocase protein TatA